MKRMCCFFLSLFLLFSCGEKTVECIIVTKMGDIKIELYPERAPVTVENFLAYVEDGAYTGSSFFRVCTPANEEDREIKIEVIQGAM